VPSRNRIFIPASPDRVFAVLSDPFTYQEWVVGTSEVRDADPNYPTVGSKLYHRVGMGPLGISDRTKVLELEPGRRIVLDARFLPLGRARVSITLEGDENGTRVLMEEEPGDARSRFAMAGPLAERLLHARNTEALSRLRRVVLRGGNPTDTSAHEDGARPGRRVLITGASSGIGLATAQLLAKRGDSIALVARGDKGLEAAAETIRSAPAHTYAADTTDRESLQVAFGAASRDLGGIDVVVAGAAAIAFGPFTEMSPEEFDATVASVFLGTVNTVREALPYLEREAGTLIVLGSVLGRVPQPFLAAYSASKHAVRGFVESLRAELADDGSPVSISEIDPWAVDTPIMENMTSATGLLPPDSIAGYDAQAVAQRVVELIDKPQRRVTFGARAIGAVAVYTFARPIADAGLVLLSRYMRAGGDVVSASAGGIAGPSGEGRISGPIKRIRTLSSLADDGRDLVRNAFARS
jgi:NAD(P)-dependent dehydrogenase (short-subunit alcohol dehydrogenase family)/uncharacterized protein YndB with AHSA1/START domain